jgi:alpha-tubulin suppressor-like RCC1 family protein
MRKKMKNTEIFSERNRNFVSRKSKKSIVVIRLLVVLEVLIVAALLVILGNGKTKKRREELMYERLTAASVDHSAWIRNGTLSVAGEAYENQDEIKKWSNLVQVAISDDHIVALDAEGTVYAVGSNSSMQCEINGMTEVSYIEAGMNCSIAVMEEGTVQVFGIMEENWREELKAEENVSSISMGDNHIAVLHNDGHVTAYGNNESGQCEVKDWKDICQISVGYEFTVGLTKQGRVVFTGNDSYHQNVSVAWENISEIAAGSAYIVGKDKDGKVYAAGLNTQGECNVNAWNSMISIAAGYDHTIGLSKSGEVYAVGFNGSGQCDL